VVGWAIDYLDPRAFDNYWREIVDSLLDEAGPLVGRSLKYLHTDSWGGTGELDARAPALVPQLRGYDLHAYLPARRVRGD
jgi:hypothetical protein